jgi:hypothetical protein
MLYNLPSIEGISFTTLKTHLPAASVLPEYVLGKGINKSRMRFLWQQIPEKEAFGA